MSRRGAGVLAWLSVCAFPLAIPVASAAAGERYVALGDSYTAGPFIPNMNSAPIGCARSDHNYPSLVRTAIKPDAFTDESCSGAVTADMTGAQKPVLIGPEAGLLGVHRPQFDALRPDTTLVTIGIGGNDAGLVTVGYQCAALGLLQATGSPCKDSFTAGGVDTVEQRIRAAAPKMAAVFRGIHQRSPNARVLVVGYPSVVPDDGRTCRPILPFADGDVPYFAGLLKRINAMIAAQAAANDVEYVDVYSRTLDADVCRPPGRPGYTFIVPENGLSLPAHPNAKGMRLAADAVLAQLAKAPTALAPAPRRSALRLGAVTLRRRSITVTGTIDRAYRGRIAVTVTGHAGTRAVRLTASATATASGHWRVTIARPSTARARLGRLTITAAAAARDGLTSGRARRTTSTVRGRGRDRPAGVGAVPG